MTLRNLGLAAVAAIVILGSGCAMDPEYVKMVNNPTDDPYCVHEADMVVAPMYPKEFDPIATNKVFERRRELINQCNALRRNRQG
jgi:hypothetical protein